jgi:hypothetical protein
MTLEELKPRAKFGASKDETIEQLARIACSLNGFKADEQMRLTVGDRVEYEGPAWQEPEMIRKAHDAYDALLPTVLRKFRDT